MANVLSPLEAAALKALADHIEAEEARFLPLIESSSDKSVEGVVAAILAAEPHNNMFAHLAQPGLDSFVNNLAGGIKRQIPADAKGAFDWLITHIRDHATKAQSSVG